jgi:hypothetical protein
METRSSWKQEEHLNTVDGKALLQTNPGVFRWQTVHGILILKLSRGSSGSTAGRSFLFQLRLLPINQRWSDGDCAGTISFQSWYPDENSGWYYDSSYNFFEEIPERTEYIKYFHYICRVTKLKISESLSTFLVFLFVIPTIIP